MASGPELLRNWYCGLDHGRSMKKKTKKEFDDATRAGVMKEMAKPRMSKSAREGEINLAAARTVSAKRKSEADLIREVPGSTSNRN
jgi:hypothetical protein